MWWNCHSERLTLWAAGHTMSQPGSGPSPRVPVLCQVGHRGGEGVGAHGEGIDVDAGSGGASAHAIGPAGSVPHRSSSCTDRKSAVEGKSGEGGRRPIIRTG